MRSQKCSFKNITFTHTIKQTNEKTNKRRRQRQQAEQPHNETSKTVLPTASRQRRQQTAWNFRIRKHERRVCELLPLFWLILVLAYMLHCCSFSYCQRCAAARCSLLATHSIQAHFVDAFAGMFLLLLDFSHSSAYKNLRQHHEFEQLKSDYRLKINKNTHISTYI